VRQASEVLTKILRTWGPYRLHRAPYDEEESLLESDMRVGIIGAGLLGSAIVERLIAAGYRVVGYDIRGEAREALTRLGGEPVASAASVASEAGPIILSLPTSTIAGAVLNEIAGKLRPGAVVIDTTTGSPDDAVEFSGKLRGLGVSYLEAMVGGSSSLVRAGEAILICGGASDVFERYTCLLETFSRNAFFVGPAGSGARMKLVLNLVLGLNRAVLAEGLEFARAVGIDPYIALEILKAGPAYSRAMDAKGRRMLNEDFKPEARLSQHLKDVRLILACGEQSGARLPLSAVHQELLEAAERAGFGAADNSAIIKAFSS
jgi:3-hydroxyisobutyrate dehydrogenase-like beta-hydroxyacid dehydrogenase